MISSTYDFKEFLDAMLEKSYVEIIIAADSECSAAQGHSYGVKGAVKAREAGSTGYAAQVKAFLFFLRSGIRPMIADDWEFSLYHPVCEALVQKQQFKSSVLDMFK